MICNCCKNKAEYYIRFSKKYYKREAVCKSFADYSQQMSIEFSLIFYRYKINYHNYKFIGRRKI